MKVLFLGGKNPECEKLLQFFHSAKEEVITIVEKITLQELQTINPEIIVSYNYRFILKPEIFSFPRLGTVNLHVSYLPWNRGADPNFWSHVENTPKGVTVHYIDDGIDTGDIIGQELVEFSDDDTLKTSYEKLHQTMQKLFCSLWQDIRIGMARRSKQAGEGTFHLAKDKDPFLPLLKKGYDTPISVLAGQGRNHKSIHEI